MLIITPYDKNAGLTLINTAINGGLTLTGGSIGTFDSGVESTLSSQAIKVGSPDLSENSYLESGSLTISISGKDVNIVGKYSNKDELFTLIKNAIDTSFDSSLGLLYETGNDFYITPSDISKTFKLSTNGVLPSVYLGEFNSGGTTSLEVTLAGTVYKTESVPMTSATDFASALNNAKPDTATPDSSNQKLSDILEFKINGNEVYASFTNNTGEDFTIEHKEGANITFIDGALINGLSSTNNEIAVNGSKSLSFTGGLDDLTYNEVNKIYYNMESWRVVLVK